MRKESNQGTCETRAALHCSKDGRWPLSEDSSHSPGEALCSRGSLFSYRHHCIIFETGLWLLLRTPCCTSLTLVPALQSPLFLQDRKGEMAHFGMLNTFMFNSSYTFQALSCWWYLEVFEVYFWTFSCLLEHISPFLHLSAFISPIISLRSLQRKGTLMFSLAVFLPQSQCQQIATIDEPCCVGTLLYINSRDSQGRQATADWASSMDI